MSKILLKIENLWVENEGKKILKGVNLEVRKGEIHAILGPNASGKSTLAKIILGYPKYKIISGKIIFNGRDITKFPPEKRAKLGLAMAWQAPPAIRGVKLFQLLERISPSFAKASEGKCHLIGIELLEREVNLNFSGGERKISEMMQLLAQKPKVALFDEIDSGLDMKRLDVVSKTIKKEFAGKETAVLIIN